MSRINKLLAYPKGLRLYQKYKSRKSRTIVVLGMHRSGTSFFTRLITLSGARISEQLVGASSSNPYGHWEDEVGVFLNDQILRSSGGAWDQPPKFLQADTLTKLRMKKFLGELHPEGQTAVWKDPRTCLTIPIWMNYIQNPYFVCIYRDPMSVARSLEKRNGIPIEKGIELWEIYNQAILDFCERASACLFVNFDLGKAHFQEKLREIIQANGLEGDLSALDTYDEATVHHSAKIEEYSPATKKILDSLSERI